jgi:hypothetical protein
MKTCRLGVNFDAHTAPDAIDRTGRAQAEIDYRPPKGPGSPFSNRTSLALCQNTTVKKFNFSQQPASPVPTNPMPNPFYNENASAGSVQRQYSLYNSPFSLIKYFEIPFKLSLTVHFLILLKLIHIAHTSPFHRNFVHHKMLLHNLTTKEAISSYLYLVLEKRTVENQQ